MAPVVISAQSSLAVARLLDDMLGKAQSVIVVASSYHLQSAQLGLLATIAFAPIHVFPELMPVARVKAVSVVRWASLPRIPATPVVDARLLHSLKPLVQVTWCPVVYSLKQLSVVVDQVPPIVSQAVFSTEIHKHI